MTTLRAGAATDVGRVRTNNQDQYLVAEPLFAVADGMGGHVGGEVAAQTALDALAVAFSEDPDAETEPDRLAAAVRTANRAVWDAAEADRALRGMGTTLTGLALVRAERRDVIAVVNVGDSRTYRLRDGRLDRLTSDHSLVAELVAEGRISEEEAEVHPQRHVLTRALGVYPDVDVDLESYEPEPGDRFLLCSDGLIREVSDTQVAEVLRRLPDPDQAANELVARARANGGNDNITVVVVDVVDPAASEPDTAVLPVFSDQSLAAAPTHPSPSGERAAPSPAPERPKARLLTVRVVLFFAAALVILGAAFAALAWYARDSWFVQSRGRQIVIYRGRPGGVLWWKPTVAEVPPLTTAGVLSVNLPALRSGVEESSLAAARAYVRNLQTQKATSSPPSSTTTTTRPAPTTTRPKKRTS